MTGRLAFPSLLSGRLASASVLGLALLLGALCLGPGCGARCEGDSCACVRDSDCPETHTCAVLRGAAPSAACVPRRGGAATFAACNADGDCERGSCLFGACQPLCREAADCPGGAAAATCAATPVIDQSGQSGQSGRSGAETDRPASWPRVSACLPRGGTLRAQLPASGGGALFVPDTARGVALFLSAPDYNLKIALGFEEVRDPAGQVIYRRALDDETFFANPARFQRGLGSATLLLSATPRRAPLQPGVYRYRAFGEDEGGQPAPFTVEAFYQLADAPLAAGRLPLRIHIPNLAGLDEGCKYRDLKAASAEALLAPALQRLREIYAQDTTRITFDPITFEDVSTAYLADLDSPTSLGAALRGGTEDGSGGVDVVLMRMLLPHFTSGQSGGIPGAPGVPGTTQTGVAVSLEPICFPGTTLTDRDLGHAMAHEIGHSLGLWHSRDDAGHADPLGDGGAPSESAQDPDNLMYWRTTPSRDHISAEQGQVMRSMPQVQAPR